MRGLSSYWRREEGVALILDTRFLIAHAFPPSDEERRSVATFLSRISKERLLIPSIAIVEFIKVAGTRLGAEQAGMKLKLWIARGAGVLSVDEETAFPRWEIGA
jgi:predicted nucleic acid-binding protein